MFLLVLSVGNPVIQFIGIPIVGFILIFIYGFKSRMNSKELFFVFMILISSFQLLFFWKESFSLNYCINSIIASGMWVLMLVASRSGSTILSALPFYAIDKSLKLFFWFNVLIMIFQYILIAVDKNSILPHLVSMGSGDFIKGVFTNSSVSFIVFSFYVVYFYHFGDRLNAVLAIIFMLASTYMSGIVIFLGITLFMVFAYFSLGTKLKIITGIIVSIIIFSFVSPKNVDYVVENITQRLFSETDQARKMVSFNQTGKFITSGVTEAFFGAGGGKFSSRTAFLTAGDYTEWFPDKYKFMSMEFEKNHFSLWNSELLKVPFKDGTANQPFSFYNKLFGEYGLFGFFMFLIFYLGNWIRNFSYLTYGKHIFFLILAYFVLDYWFDYFTVIVFCELFMRIDLNRRLEYEKREN